MATHLHAHLVDGQLERRRPSHFDGHTPTTAAKETTPARVQESHLTDRDSLIGRSDSCTCSHAVSGQRKNRLEQEQCTLIAVTGQPSPRSGHKRNVQEMDAEEKADRAANEIVDLVEQEVQLKPTMAANQSSYEIINLINKNQVF